MNFLLLATTRNFFFAVLIFVYKLFTPLDLRDLIDPEDANTKTSSTSK